MIAALPSEQGFYHYYQAIAPIFILLAQHEKQFGFPKTRRLVKNEQFRAVIALRKRASDGRLTIYAAPNGLDFARIGISIGRSSGSAVFRNRFKRLVREAFRKNKENIPAGRDYVVTPGPRLEANPAWADIQDSLLALADLSSKK